MAIAEPFTTHSCFFHLPHRRRLNILNSVGRPRGSCAFPTWTISATWQSVENGDSSTTVRNIDRVFVNVVWTLEDEDHLTVYRWPQ